MKNGTKKFCALLFIFVLILTSIPLGSLNSYAESKQEKIYSKDGCEVYFVINSKWDTGFEGQFVIHNTSAVPLENWKMQIKK